MHLLPVAILATVFVARVASGSIPPYPEEIDADAVCEDVIAKCADMADKCTHPDFQPFMVNNCKKTCGTCDLCVDGLPQCSDHPDYCTQGLDMDIWLINCPKTCNQC